MIVLLYLLGTFAQKPLDILANVACRCLRSAFFDVYDVRESSVGAFLVCSQDRITSSSHQVAFCRPWYVLFRYNDGKFRAMVTVGKGVRCDREVFSAASASRPPFKEDKISPGEAVFLRHYTESLERPFRRRRRKRLRPFFELDRVINPCARARLRFFG